MYREKNKYGVEIKRLGTQWPADLEKKVKDFCKKNKMTLTKFIAEASELRMRETEEKK